MNRSYFFFLFSRFYRRAKIFREVRGEKSIFVGGSVFYTFNLLVKPKKLAVMEWMSFV